MDLAGRALTAGLRCHRLVALAAVAIACSTPAAPVQPEMVVEAREPLLQRAAADTGLPPLVEQGDLIDLEVPGFGSAVVAVPLRTTVPRPVVVVAHGSTDRPDWQCQAWAGILAGKAFALCVRGSAVGTARDPEQQRYGHGSTSGLRAEIDAAMAALRQRFGPYVAAGAMTMSGFSVSATMMPGVCARHGVPCGAAVSIEGTYGGWTAAALRAFTRQGGRRVLVACGRPGCVAPSMALVRRLEAAAIRARVVYGVGTGHHYVGAVAGAIRQSLDWLTEGDPRYAPPAAPVEAEDVD